MRHRILPITFLVTTLALAVSAQDFGATVVQDPSAGTATYTLLVDTPPNGNLTPFFVDPFPKQTPFVGPSGLIYVPFMVPGPHWVLHTIPPLGGPPTPLFVPPLDDGRNDVLYPYFAPDGLSLYVTQFREDGTSVIRHIDPSGGDLGIVIDRGARTGCSSAAATPGGDRLFYSSNHDGDFEIYSADLNGANEIKLTNNNLFDAGPAPKGDGSKIAFSRVDPFQPGVTQIWVMDFDGSNQVMVTNPATPGIKAPFAWVGSNIVYTSSEAGNFDLFMIDENGQGKTVLQNSPDAELYALPADLCGFPGPELFLDVIEPITPLGDPTNFEVVGGGAPPSATYTWAIGDGTAAMTTTPFLTGTYTQPGDFPVTVFVDDPPNGVFRILPDIATVFDPVYPGTGDDIRLFTGIDDTPDALDFKEAFPGQTLFIDYDSPGGTYFDDPYLIAGQLFTPGQPPFNNIPGLYLNLFGFSPFILVDGLNPLGPLPPPPILPGGNLHGFPIPPGVGGLDLMLQALVLTPNSGNGFLGVSDGKIISFP